MSFKHQLWKRAFLFLFFLTSNNTFGIKQKCVKGNARIWMSWRGSLEAAAIYNSKVDSSHAPH